MPNTFFKFKQFTVEQDKAAMKVCTDACLFGAWIANKYQHQNIHRVLDIGTGTGLLSLMFAQKNTAKIDAVETDENAALQAEENFSNASFGNAIHLHQCDILNFRSDIRYDLIISNPPFFEQHLKSQNHGRNLALHSEQLSLPTLINCIQKLIANDGQFALLLPYYRLQEAITNTAAAGFFLHEKVLVKQTQQHDYFRCMLLFGTDEATCIQSSFTIKNNNIYSNEFTALLKDYYLYL